MKKILIITNIPAPYKIEFFNQLAVKSDLTVIFERSEASNRDKEWVKDNKYKFNHKNLKGINYGGELTLSFEVLKYIEKDKYDIVIMAGYSSITAIIAIIKLRLKKIPFILAVDGAIYEQKNIIKESIKKALISTAEWYISTGKETDKYLMRFGATPAKIYRAPLSSVKEKEILENKQDKETKQIYKKKMGVKTELMILSVGQFIHRKGYDILLHAVTRLDMKITLCLIGGEPTDEYLQITRNNKFQEIHFCKFSNKEKLSNYYRAADIFVLPTREDIWGLVINEAMAHGLPIVATNKCNSMLEMMRSSDIGYIVDTEDVDQLIIAIKKLLGNVEDASVKSSNALRLIKKNTVEEMVLAYTKIFKDIENVRR